MSRSLGAVMRGALRIPTAVRWVAVVAWAAMIFVLSDRPGLAVSDDPGVDLPARHLAHVVVYGVLASLLAWALSGRRMPSTRLLAACGVVTLLYGVTDEWHQTFVPTRTGRPEDLVWDALGAAIAVVAISLVRGVLDPGDDAS